MPWDVLIREGKVVTPEGVRDLDIAIENETIVELAAGLSGSAKEEIDASWLHVFPGVIDAHVHFNEPGRTDWEGFDTGSAALAAGGGTCFFDMPLNASPPTLDGQSFDLKLAAAKANSRTDFALWGGLTPTNLDTMEELAERGVVGFKAFMSNSGIEDFERTDEGTLRRGMEIAARLGMLVAVHAEDEALTRDASAAAMRGGATTWRDYLQSRSPFAEKKAIRCACQIARETKCRLHVVHVSIQPGVYLIDTERYHQLDVSCETCPHYLLLNDEDLRQLGAAAKCAPPVRSEELRELLWKAVLNKKVQIIASDHSPAPASMKEGANAFKIWGGISGVQSTLASLLTLEPRLPLELVAALTSGNVAKRFRIENKGIIAAGFDADLALVDTNAQYVLTREMLLDRHKLSPYVGRTFRGLVKRTIVRGQTVFQNGSTVGSFRGRLLTPSKGAARA